MRLRKNRLLLVSAGLVVACSAADDPNAGRVETDLSVVANQAYTIVGVQSGKCVEIVGGSTANSALAQIATCNGTTRQQFRFEDMGGGYLRIRNVNSNLCLDVNGASTTAGASVIQYTCSTANNQQWMPSDVSTGVTQFVARHSGQAMDVNGRGTADGTPIIQWTLNTTATNQQFRVTAVGGTGTGGATGTGGTPSTGGTAGSGGSAGSLPTGHYQMEKLNRGVVASVVSGGVYVGWRMFGYEYDPNNASSTTYNLYRNGTRIATVTNSTNYLDTGGSSSSTYSVRAVIGGAEQASSETASTWAQNYLRIPLQIPAGGTSPDGVAYTYSANDASVGDLDGDGQYEIVLKWDPSNSKDNSQSGYTGNVFLDAYKLNGTRLWRIDLGRNIRAGAHYTQFVVYDFDGDGKAELAVKTAPNTRDGTGKYLGLGPAASDDDNADYRNSSGYVLTGPEYLSVFNGPTGAELATVNFDVPRGTVSSWGDSYGNRVDRFLASAAFVSDSGGQSASGRPSILMARGYYTRATITAWNWRNGQLTEVWKADSNNSTAYTGQGAHTMAVADVDNDGAQEIVYGASTIDSNGTRKCSTGFGHGDALHVGDLVPSRAGLEVFMPHEDTTKPSYDLRDANTCAVIQQGPVTGSDTGRGVADDVYPGNAGAEMWTNSSGNLLSATSGGSVGSLPGSSNFLVWWDADESRELENGTSVTKYGGGTLLSCSSCASNNGTKSTPALTADLLGDWREEVVWRESNNSALRVYTTTAVTARRIYTLMHDPQYRMQVSSEQTAYNQPPHPSFHIGSGMGNPPKPDINVK